MADDSEEKDITEQLCHSSLSFHSDETTTDVDRPSNSASGIGLHLTVAGHFDQTAMNEEGSQQRADCVRQHNENQRSAVMDSERDDEETLPKTTITVSRVSQPLQPSFYSLNNTEMTSNFSNPVSVTAEYLGESSATGTANHQAVGTPESPAMKEMWDKFRAHHTGNSSMGAYQHQENRQLQQMAHQDFRTTSCDHFGLEHYARERFAFKVWSADRQSKRMVTSVSSLAELIHNGCTKLRIPTSGCRVVLEEDGTEIDDDDSMLACKDKTFIILSADQQWSSTVDHKETERKPPPLLPSVTSPEALTLLLLGESGVGKSTWINAFANYVSYLTFNEAKKGGGKFPIPSSFNVFDPETNIRQTISTKVGGHLSADTDSETGGSVTKIPSEYQFRVDNLRITIIDTPGLQDSENVKGSHSIDHQNLNHIFHVLSQYDQLNGICIFLKADQTRLSASFRYCLSEIFNRLHESAKKNVVFIATNANCMMFCPGEAISVLEKFLKQNHVGIPFSGESPTVYCFENNIVQRLAENMHSIQRTEEYDVQIERCWKYSKESVYKMTRCIHNLPPHQLTGTMSIFEASWIISSVASIILNTLTNVYSDRRQANAKSKEIDDIVKDISKNPRNYAKYDTMPFLYAEETEVVTVELEEPIVVCKSKKCVTVVNGVTVCRPCCINCDSFSLYQCKKVNRVGICTSCGCHIRSHKWTSSEDVIRKTKRFISESSTIRHLIETDEAVRGLQLAVDEHRKLAEKCSTEIDKMIQLSAKLAVFRRQNVLMRGSRMSTADDEITELLDRDIDLYQRALSTHSDTSIQDHLRDLCRIREQYEGCVKATENNKCTSRC